MTGRRPRVPRLGPGMVSLMVAAVALAGCSAAPAPDPSASSPPAPSFPAVAGTSVSASDDGGLEWHRVVRVADSEAGYREARRLLVDGGFTLTKDRQGTGGGDGQACTPELCVGFSATDGTAAGPIVAYDVFRPSGVVD